MSWRALSRSYDVRNLCRGVVKSLVGWLVNQQVAANNFCVTELNIV